MDWVESDYSLDTAMRFARAGALVRVLPVPDACDACIAMASRTYLPSEVPRLPIRGCTNDRCRCTFVAVDPETQKSVPELVQWGIRTLKAGRRQRARHILERALLLDERYEPGWLWLTAVVDAETQVDCLKRVLELNPGNEQARAGLKGLRPPPASTSQPDSESLAGVVEPPPELAELRQERQIILIQWSRFLAVAANLDAKTLLAQGRAFLAKLDDLGAEAYDLASQGTPLKALRLQELQHQWQETIEVTAALANASQAHQARSADDPGWQATQDALHRLARQLSERRETLSAALLATGDSPQA